MTLRRAADEIIANFSEINSALKYWCNQVRYECNRAYSFVQLISDMNVVGGDRLSDMVMRFWAAHYAQLKIRTEHVDRDNTVGKFYKLLTTLCECYFAYQRFHHEFVVDGGDDDDDRRRRRHRSSRKRRRFHPYNKISSSKSSKKKIIHNDTTYAVDSNPTIAELLHFLLTGNDDDDDDDDYDDDDFDRRQLSSILHCQPIEQQPAAAAAAAVTTCHQLTCLNNLLHRYGRDDIHTPFVDLIMDIINPLLSYGYYSRHRAATLADYMKKNEIKQRKKNVQIMNGILASDDQTFVRSTILLAGGNSGGGVLCTTNNIQNVAFRYMNSLIDSCH